MSRSVKLDTEALRAAQARAQEVDRIGHDPVRDDRDELDE